MKKIKLLFGLVLSLLLVGVVKAAGPYNLEFETTVQTEETAYQHEDYQNGYLLSTYDSGHDYLKYYSAKGELLKSTSYPEYIEGIKADGKDIYLLLLSDGNNYYVAKLNENLEEVARKQVTVTLSEGDGLYHEYLDFLEFSNSDYIFIDGDTIVVFSIRIGFITAKKDLTEATARAVTEQDVIKYFPAYPVMKTIWQRIEAHNEYFEVFDYSEGNLITEIAKPNANCEEEEEDIFPDIGIYAAGPKMCRSHEIRLYDQAGNVKWTKEVADNEIVSELRFSNGYILAMYDSNGNTSANKIVVYDMKGNVKQTLNSNIGFYNIKPTTVGFMVKQFSCKKYGPPIDNVIGLPESSANLDYNLREEPGKGDVCRSNHQVYSIVLNIDTKVTKGKGTIEAIKSSKPGEPVTFVVTPEPGYVLGEVRVTDANGKTIVFKQNTFTMPTADVLIEAEFLPANPETKDLAITIILLIAIFAGMFGLVQLRKTKEMK